MANVTETQMEVYLRTFHEEYIGTVETFVPAEARAQLIRYSLLPVPVTGYVSTQLGAGYEYGLGDEDISTRLSSRRIEELFVDGPSSLARSGPMFLIGGRNIGFSALTLEGAFPFRFTGEAADVYFHDIRFKAGTWSRNVLFAHLFADRREEFWSETVAVVVLTLLAVLSSCGGDDTPDREAAQTTTATEETTETTAATTAPEAESDCLRVPRGTVAAIAEGLTTSGRGRLRSARAAVADKDEDFRGVKMTTYLVSADIQAPGLEGDDDIATWAVTRSLDVAELGLILAVDSIAKEFSTWGEAANPGSPVGDWTSSLEDDDGFDESRDCAEAG